jgi:hypothetical protein
MEDFGLHHGGFGKEEKGTRNVVDIKGASPPLVISWTQT